MAFKPTRIFVVPPKAAPSGKPPRKTPNVRHPADGSDEPEVKRTPPPPVQAEAQPKPPPPPPRPPAPPQAPIGSDFILVVDQTRLLSLAKLGETIDVLFKVEGGPGDGTSARGQFPLTGKGLAILIEAVFGEKKAWEPAMLEQLAAKKILADVAHAGTAERPLATVRNIRTAGQG